MKKSKDESQKGKRSKTIEEGIKHYEKLAFEYELMKGVVEENYSGMGKGQSRKNKKR